MAGAERTQPMVEPEVEATWDNVAARLDATVAAVLLVVALFVPWLVESDGELLGVAHRHVLGGAAVNVPGVLLVAVLLATAARPWALLQVASALLGVAVALLAQQVRFDDAFGTAQATGIDNAVTAVLLAHAVRVALRLLRQASVPGRFRWTD